MGDERGSQDFENMKVVDLKKKLKEFGLPVSGTKLELVERLHEHILKGGTSDIGEIPGTFDSILECSEVNSSIVGDSILDMDDDFSFSSPEKEALSSEEAVHLKVAVPLKKRVVAQSLEDTVKMEKKIILKRNNVPTPKFAPALSVETLETDELAHTNIAKKAEDPFLTSDKCTSNIIQLSAKNLSQNERINLRSKKFKENPEECCFGDGKVTSSSNLKNRNVTVFSRAVSFDNSLDVLKKRTARFGECVSMKIKKLEDQERVSKRKEKFGAVGNGRVDEQEKKRKRAERFGL